VTLGQDEEPPVANLSSPFVNATDAGDDIAGILEQSEFVVKVSGFDNVAATRAELRGVKREGTRYVLTGNPNDVLQDELFPIDQIPGVLRAYSALRLVRAPAFENSSAGEFDRYPISIKVFDEVGNSSTVNVIIGVFADQKPDVVSITPINSLFFASDIFETDILLRDDRSVERVEVEYLLGDVVIESRTLDRDSGLVPMQTVQVNERLNLTENGVTNENHTLTIKVRAYDVLAQESDELIKQVSIVEDAEAPVATLSEPIQGSTLYGQQSTNFSVTASDQSPIAQIEVFNGSERISRANYVGQSVKRINYDFSYTIPSDADELKLTIVASDIFNNETSRETVYPIEQDQPPVISFRHPAAGSRLIEGEPFTINALVSDNRAVSYVEFFVEKDGVVLFNGIWCVRDRCQG